MREIIVALAGNPNAGKTTVFNSLTGSRQHVGNYPGVTVEKKEGMVEHNGVRYRVVDLPGTYSLSASSPEEVVARNFLVQEKPDVVVQVVDASNLERNLYLATQLMELGVKLVVALNMIDVAKTRGLEFDVCMLALHLKSPVIPTVGNRSQGMDVLLDAVAETADKPVADYPPIKYPKDFETAVAEIDAALTGPDRQLADLYPPGWVAARLFENDDDVTARMRDKALLEKVEDFRDAFEVENDDPPEIRSAEAKYGWITGLCAEVSRLTAKARSDMSDKVDAVLLHRVLGLPVFLLMMYVMFQLVFTLAERPMEWIERLFGVLGSSIAHLWPKGAESPLRDLIVDGVIGGVGGVMVFLPNIILLFLAIAFLEGTGYMARAAFIMDSLMHRIGLHGKSFIPMLLGFGCTVPAIMATRTLENRRDRLTTILVLPFMSCGARLPIYTLLIPAFFPERERAWILWLLYITGIVFAVVGAKILRGTLFKGESVPFVMELPPYRMPTFRAVLTLMWDRASEYCKKAGTIILGASIILWAMTAYPKKETFDRDYEAETAAATERYIDGVAEIGKAIGAGPDGAALVDWAKDRLTLAEAHEAHWENSPEVAQAENEHRATMETLFNLPEGPALAGFVHALDGVEKTQAAFEEATADMEEGSDEYRIALVDKAKRQAELNLDPGVEAAATTYFYDIRGVYDERMTEIANSMEAESLSYSISGRVGKFLEPVLRPLGFDWRVATAIIGSFAAKEVFVAQMGIVFSVGTADEDSDSLREKLRENYTQLQAFCMMLYCLLSMPCVATIAVAKRETGGWRYALGMLVGFTAVAYVTTFLVYQLGGLLGMGA